MALPNWSSLNSEDYAGASETKLTDFFRSGHVHVRTSTKALCGLA